MYEIEKLLPIALFSLFGLGGVLIMLRLVIEKRMKEQHSDEWVRLGEPKMFSGEPEVNTRFVAYLNKKEFRHLNDEKLERINQIAGIISWAAIPLLLTVVILFLISWRVI